MPFSDLVQNLLTGSIFFQILMGLYFAAKYFYYVAVMPKDNLKYPILVFEVFIGIMCLVPVFGSIFMFYFVVINELTENKRGAYWLTRA